MTPAEGKNLLAMERFPTVRWDTFTSRKGITMACNAGKYAITTAENHNPTWSGTLEIDGSGNATFTLNGGVSGGGSVNAQCGSDSQGNWLQFTNTHAVGHSVHYQKAHWNGTSYHGPCENNSSVAKDVDEWTATPSSHPVHKHH